MFSRLKVSSRQLSASFSQLKTPLVSCQFYSTQTAENKKKQHKVLVVGAGRVGRTILHMLNAEDNYGIRLCDVKPEAADRVIKEILDPNSGVPGKPITLETGLNVTVKGPPIVEAFPEPVDTEEQLVKAMKGTEAVISSAPFTANKRIAKAAAIAGVHYLDLTEDVQVTRFVKELAQKTNSCAFIPQCGVAPGFITLAATHVINKFDQVDDVVLRVGALPDQPNNRLKYNLTWSTEGLVNEYIHPCEALKDGKLVTVNALEGEEEVVIDGVTYEAFNTSGGVGTLCHTYEGKIKNMTYKTLRYRGHLDYIRFLMEDLKFREHPEELVRIFHRSIPATLMDVVIVSVRALGMQEGRYLEKTFWRRVLGRLIGRHAFTGIEIATASGICGIADRLLNGHLPRNGLIKIEDVGYNNFMHSPFGRYYARK